jgi:hypothetical protein
MMVMKHFTKALLGDHFEIVNYLLTGCNMSLTFIENDFKITPTQLEAANN